MSLQTLSQIIYGLEKWISFERMFYCFEYNTKKHCENILRVEIV